jgi:hypothetical protein
VLGLYSMSQISLVVPAQPHGQIFMRMFLVVGVRNDFVPYFFTTVGRVSKFGPLLS